MNVGDARDERSLPAVLAKRVARHGDRPWIVSGARTVSYREMDRLSSRLAAGLSAIGVGAGDTVLLMLPDSLGILVAWCALAKLGAIEVPVNTHLRGGVLTHVLNDSGARTLILDQRFADRVEAVAENLVSVEQIVLHAEDADASEARLPPALAGRFRAHAFDTLLRAEPTEMRRVPRPRDLAAVMYTSGTTGPSKGVMITHAHAYEYAMSCVELLELTRDDVYYSPLPLFHIAGQWAAVYACCIAGATVVVPPAFSLQAFWADIRAHKATCSFLLGAMANFLYRQPADPRDAETTMDRMLVVPLLPEIEGFKVRFGCRVSTTWGSTEINVPMRSGFELADNKTCGRVADDRYEVRIVDEDDNALPPGVPGEALVRAKDPWILMAGYWRNPEATAAAWRNQWVHSGDMLMHDGAGNYYFVDRTKDAIRRRGENISSMEVEREVNAFPPVLECAVIPVESEHTEQEVMAVVVPKDGEAVDPVALIRFVEPRMAYFMVPRYVDVVDALPKTQTGKIQKFTLCAQGLTPTTWDREAAGIKLTR